MAERGVEPRLFWGWVRGFLYRLLPAGAGPAQKERMDDRDDAGDNCDDEDDEDGGHGDDSDGKFECFCGGAAGSTSSAPSQWAPLIPLGSGLIVLTRQIRQLRHRRWGCRVLWP